MLKSYADFNSSLSLSAIIAINSLLVGFPLTAEIVYPNIFSTVSFCPRPHIYQGLIDIQKYMFITFYVKFMIIKIYLIQ